MHLTMTVLGLLFVFHSTQVFAGESSKKPTCLEQLTKNQRWPLISDKQLACMNAIPEFVSGMAYLCSKDGSTISSKYQKYLEFKQRYEDAVQKFRAATDMPSRNSALLEARYAEEDWSLFGNRAEASRPLNEVSSAHFHCRQ